MPTTKGITTFRSANDRPHDPLAADPRPAQPPSTRHLQPPGRPLRAFPCDYHARRTGRPERRTIPRLPCHRNLISTLRTHCVDHPHSTQHVDSAWPLRHSPAHPNRSDLDSSEILFPLLAAPSPCAPRIQESAFAPSDRSIRRHYPG